MPTMTTNISCRCNCSACNAAAQAFFWANACAAEFDFTQVQLYLKDSHMARKKKQDTKFVEFDFKQIVWANVPMSDDDYASFDETLGDQQFYLDGLCHLVQQGWKLTASQQDNGQSFRYTAICLLADSPSVNIGTSAFSDNPYEALCLLVYKIIVMADFDLSDYPAGGSRRRRG